MFSSCCTARSLEVALATVFEHADRNDETIIRHMIVMLLRKYAASTTNPLDDEIVDIVQRCLFAPPATR